MTRETTIRPLSVGLMFYLAWAVSGDPARADSETESPFMFNPPAA